MQIQSHIGEVVVFLGGVLSAPAAPSIPAAPTKGSLTALIGFAKVLMVITLIYDTHEAKALFVNTYIIPDILRLVKGIPRERLHVCMQTESL